MAKFKVIWLNKHGENMGLWNSDNSVDHIKIIVGNIVQGGIYFFVKNKKTWY